jgi:thiamine transporter ThiT
MKDKKVIQKITLSAMFTALAFVLPFFTMQIEKIGDMLCPMHIPVILCGFICGAPWGLLVGVISPLLRSLIMTMPVMFPTAICMAFELGTYGLVAGLLYNALPKKKPYIYVSLAGAMVTGRIVWGIARIVLLGFDFSKFGWSAFWAGAVLNAIPGIIVQIVLIPVVVMAIEKASFLNRK